MVSQEMKQRAHTLIRDAKAGEHDPEFARQRRWALRADVSLSLAAAVALAGVAAWAVWVTGADPKGWGGAIITGAVALLIACIGGITRITTARQNLITLFSSEIRAIQYGLTVMGMFDFWLDVFNKPDEGTKGWADAPRTSDYFAIFHATSSTIVNQHPEVVESIVRFYTYLKMSRDAAAAVAGWRRQHPPDNVARKRDVQHIVRLLSLSLLWGFVARRAMGQHPEEFDREQLRKIESVLTAIFDDDAFPDLLQHLPRRDALEKFFGVAA